jgi:hypothetical protein
MEKGSYKDFGHDKTSFANLPQNVTFGSYPKQAGVDGEADDTITGIDEAVSHGQKQATKYASHQK